MRQETLHLELNTDYAARIREIAHEVGAVIEGDFVLASGLKSKRYFEGKKITLWPEGAHLVGEAFLEMLADTDIDAIGGLATGAYPIVTAVSLTSERKGKPIPSFVVREVVKTHGTERRIEGHIKEGWRVAIVDDVITAGGSTFKALNAAEAMQCQVVKVMAIVDRHEGGSDRIKKAGYDFSAIMSFKSTD